MTSESAVIEREWLAVAPDGTEHKLLLRVNRPTQQSRGDWAAEISMGEIDPHPYSIAGMDSWQAMHEAMLFAAVRIRHFEEQGWRFFWERGDEQVSASDVFRGA